jgi:hypothetical protein
LTINKPDEEVHAFKKEFHKIADIELGGVSKIDLLEATPFSCYTTASVWSPQE